MYLNHRNADKHLPANNLRIISPIYHHDLKPNVSETDPFGPHKAHYNTNSLGFRSRTNGNVALQSKNYRVLFLGDSFTEGIGMEYPKTFVGRIEEAWAMQGMETLNAAVASYSPIIYYRKLKYLVETVGLKIDKLVVFIDPSDIRDEVFYGLDASENVVSVTPPKTASNLSWASLGSDSRRWLHNFLTENTYVTFHVLRWIHFRLHGPFSQDQRRALWTLDAGLFDSFGREGLARATHYMDLLADLTRKNKIRLTIAVYPWPDHVLKHDLESKQVIHWRDWADRQSVGFVNLFPIFMERPESPEEVLTHFFIPYDMHWNEEGHELVAKEFLKGYGK